VTASDLASHREHIPIEFRLSEENPMSGVVKEGFLLVGNPNGIGSFTGPSLQKTK
jgi:hypothetical protein